MAKVATESCECVMPNGWVRRVQKKQMNNEAVFKIKILEGDSLKTKTIYGNVTYSELPDGRKIRHFEAFRPSENAWLKSLVSTRTTHRPRNAKGATSAPLGELPFNKNTLEKSRLSNSNAINSKIDETLSVLAKRHTGTVSTTPVPNKTLTQEILDAVEHFESLTKKDTVVMVVKNRKLKLGKVKLKFPDEKERMCSVKPDNTVFINISLDGERYYMAGMDSNGHFVPLESFLFRWKDVFPTDARSQVEG